MSIEIWKVANFGVEEVLVSSYGKVVRLCGSEVKPRINSKSLYVSYTVDKKIYYSTLAKIVGEAFIGEAGLEKTYKFSDHVSLDSVGRIDVLEHLMSVGNMGRGEKLVANFGINDVEIPTKKNNVKNIPYQTWLSMIHRCYGINQESCYDDVTVCDRWSKFSNFLDDYQYMVGSYNKGLVLDKDILFKDNTEYSEKSCVLVPKKLNTIFANLKKDLTITKVSGGFVTHFQLRNRKEDGRTFKTEAEAKIFLLEMRCNMVEYSINEFAGSVDFRVVDRMKDILKSLKNKSKDID